MAIPGPFTIFGEFDDVNPACLGPEGCASLAEHTSNAELTVGQCAQLAARCIEHCVTEGTDQVCVIDDSFVENDPRLADIAVGEV